MLAEFATAAPPLKDELFLGQAALASPHCDPRRFDWRSPPAMAEERAALAWKLTSYSAYSEQVGMLIATRLLNELEEPSAKFALASAVSDEARHSETFYRYARRIGGEVAAPPPTGIGTFIAASSMKWTHRYV